MSTYLVPVLCSWCQRQYGEKPMESPGVDHGICPDCLEAHYPERIEREMEAA